MSERFFDQPLLLDSEIEVYVPRTPNRRCDEEFDFEGVLERIEKMPPTLLQGLLCHLVRRIYARGVIHKNRVRELVRQVEDDVMKEIARKNKPHNYHGFDKA